MPPLSLKKFLIFLAAALLLWLGIRYFLPIAAPFLLAAALALLSEPLTAVFHSRLKLPRAAAAGIGVTVTLSMLLLLVMTLGALAVRQLQSLAGVVPDLEEAALSGMDSLHVKLLDMAEDAPEAVRSVAVRSVEGLFSDGTDLVGRLSSWLLGLASGVVSKLPDSVFSIGTWLLASFMISARLPQLKNWLSGHMPSGWRERTLPMLQRLKGSVLGWLTAQLKLIGITFAVLTAGFFLLRISYAPVWAALISLVDALPILGTGMILIPWSIVCLLQGQTVRAVGLLGIYAVAALLRSVLEPKLVGKQLGLDPLLTLAAMYAGYSLWGFTGLILAPLLTVTTVQLFCPQPEG